MSTSKLASRLAPIGALLALCMPPVQAAPVTGNFVLTADPSTVSGPSGAAFIGTSATGQFIYDDDFLDTAGNGIASPGAGLSMLFLTLFDSVFDASHDVDYDLLPQVGIAGYVPISLNYFLVAGANGVTFPSPAIASASAFELKPDTGSGDFVGPLYIDTVPISPTPLLLGLGLLGLAASGRAAAPRGGPAPSRRGPRRGLGHGVARGPRLGAPALPVLATALTLAGPCVAAAPAPAAANTPSDTRPNILFIVMDDVGIDQMRTFGYRLDNQPVTPAIDTLATAGMRFRNAWAMPECSPSRVSFFTGRYPLRTGVLNVTLDNTLANSQMSPFEATTPRLLRAQGYKSGFFGKWHHTAFASNDPAGNPNPGNPLANAAPRDMGWDYFEGMLEGAPRAIDTTAGGVAPPGTYSCGFVNDAAFGACYYTDGTCADLGAPGDAPGANPGRTCIEGGGILAPGAACQSETPPAVRAGFANFNGYYVSPLLINHEDARVELVAGFDDHGQSVAPTDPRARRYLTQQQTDAAIAWIKRQQTAATPWMATLSYSSAHLPTQQPARALLPPGASDTGRLDCTSLLGQRTLMNEMVEAMDREIGRLLVEIGVASVGAGGGLAYRPDATDTMVILVGDNGSYLQTVRLPFDPARSKGTAYQTGVWVPLIVSGPLVAPANTGREVPHMVNAAVDVFSLFGEIAGIDVRQAVPPGHALDAKPLLPYLLDPGQPALRKTNFTQTGTVLQAPGIVPPCVLKVAGAKICTQIFTFEELCETEGGTWYGDLTSCCQLQDQDPSVSILPFSASAIRDAQYKLVRREVQNCSTGRLDLQYEFYQVNESAPVPKLDRQGSNLLSAPTLPPRGLTAIQRTALRDLLTQMETLLRSEANCPGDGNLDKKVNETDELDWDIFAQACVGNPNRCSSVYDLNLDAVTDGEDLAIVQANRGRRCPGSRP